jgi:hypothetical protein
MEWRAFDQVDPIGGPGMDYRFGILVRTVLGLFADNSTRLPDPLDFFPWTVKPEPIVLAADDLAAAFDRLVGLQ